jgi:hypothetical protein
MRIQTLFRFLLTLLLIGPIASCSSKPKPKAKATPSPSPAISITKPITKAREAKATVEQVAKQREQANPETAPAQP